VTPLGPHALLAEARRLLDDTSTGTVSVWSRAAAMLARQALEETLRRYWLRTAPGVERLSMRAQLSCLRAYLTAPALAADVAFAWHALSRATHHHPYELDPTRDELSSLIAATQRLLDADGLHGQSGQNTGTSSTATTPNSASSGSPSRQ
jgi:hypothetical protein